MKCPQKSSEIFFVYPRNRYRVYHTLFMGINEFQPAISHYFSDLFAIWSRYLLIILLNICGFRENRSRGNWIFVVFVKIGAEEIEYLWFSWKSGQRKAILYASTWSHKDVGAAKNTCVALKATYCCIQTVNCVTQRDALIFAVQSDTRCSVCLFGIYNRHSADWRTRCTVMYVQKVVYLVCSVTVGSGYSISVQREEFLIFWVGRGLQNVFN